MISVFDAAFNGDEAAINAAIKVCEHCPLLDSCSSDRAARAPKDRWGVQAGQYETPSLPASLLRDEDPGSCQELAPAEPVTRLVVHIEQVRVTHQVRTTGCGQRLQDPLPLELTPDPFGLFGAVA